MEINGLKLPEYYQELVEKLGWDSFKEVVKKAIVNVSTSRYKDEYRVLTLEGMRVYTEELRGISKSDVAKYYGLQSSNGSDTIDIDHSIIIAVNDDEDAICLNYERDTNNSEVKEIFSLPKGHCQWVVIASNFEELLDPK